MLAGSMWARKGWRMRHGSAGAAAALGVVLLLVGGCDRGGDERFAAEPARTAEVVERVSAPGTVQAAGQAELKAPAAARVERLVVKDGEEVGSGELVAELSSEQVDDQVRQAQAAVDAASSLGGVAPTLPTGAALSAFQQVQSQVTATSAAVIAALRSALPLVPRAQRARLEARIDRAQVRVAQLQRQADQAAEQAAAATAAQADSLQRSLQAATAELALELARNQQERLTLRSPLAGNVQLGRSGGGGTTLPQVQGLPEGAEQALQGLGGGTQAAQTGPPLRVGSEVTAGQTVATVYDVSDLLVAAEVDETDIALVKPGQLARVELDAFPQAAFAAKVRRVAVAPTASQSAAGGVTYQVDLVLGEADGGEAQPVPRVGMTATAAIAVRRTTNRPSVPGSALVGRPGGQAVFVVEDGKVHLRPVQVAADGDDRVAVASGLRDGERVVSRGAERLRDGQDWPGG
jgi:multidrug efflux pump subunit AcrA (membrane-fusion protein)